MKPDLLICGLVIAGLAAYTIYLRNYTDSLHSDFNDIYDRIQQWRRAGSTDPEGYWLLSDISGIIRRRMGYPNAKVQRPVDSEDHAE